MSRSYSLFYVLGGLVNGSRDELALRTDGERLDDGHYFLLGDETDPKPGTGGPYDSREEAEEAAVRALEAVPQFWGFPLEGGDPVRLPDDWDETYDDCNVASVRRVRTGALKTASERIFWRIEIEGSYEVLTLDVSTLTVEGAVDVYRHALLASAKYQ